MACDSAIDCTGRFRKGACPERGCPRQKIAPRFLAFRLSFNDAGQRLQAAETLEEIAEPVKEIAALWFQREGLLETVDGRLFAIKMRCAELGKPEIDRPPIARALKLRRRCLQQVRQLVPSLLCFKKRREPPLCIGLNGVRDQGRAVACGRIIRPGQVTLEQVPLSCQQVRPLHRIGDRLDPPIVEREKLLPRLRFLQEIFGRAEGGKTGGIFHEKTKTTRDARIERAFRRISPVLAALNFLIARRGITGGWNGGLPVFRAVHERSGMRVTQEQADPWGRPLRLSLRFFDCRWFRAPGKEAPRDEPVPPGAGFRVTTFRHFGVVS